MTCDVCEEEGGGGGGERGWHLCALLHHALSGRVPLAGHELIQPELQDLQPHVRLHCQTA